MVEIQSQQLYIHGKLIECITKDQTSIIHDYISYINCCVSDSKIEIKRWKQSHQNTKPDSCNDHLLNKILLNIHRTQKKN